jgi:hypothetical protein
MPSPGWRRSRRRACVPIHDAETINRLLVEHLGE